MKRFRTEISVGIVCILLGFMLTYQLKAVMKQKKELEGTSNVAQITIEMEQLKKQKQNLESKINELQTQIKNYEDAATSNNALSKEIVKKLEETRILTGSVDVEGQGVVIYITPQSEFFSNNGEGPTILDIDLIKLVNELNAADAEAVSINDLRITSRTGIRSSSNYIIVNQERISPYKRITIKAIGDKIKLKKTLEFPGVLDGGFTGCDIKYEVADNIKINRHNEDLKFQYAKPINNN